jgi:CheY-like chemotaxis protein
MTKHFNILLVEDNPADVLLLAEAVDEAQPPCRLTTVQNGEEALDCLHRQGRYADCPVPDLVLLDLNLPGRHGHEILADIKGDSELQHIPVVVFSTSGSDQDILTSYRLHASSHVTKPTDLHQYMNMVGSLISYWQTTVKLPRAFNSGPSWPGR